jgi:shikimate 5-dehydrogenase
MRAAAVTPAATSAREHAKLPPKLAFVGVTTGSSSIMRLFPAWTEFLGIRAEIVGVDLALDAPPQAYRECIEWLADAEGIRGALITTHKAAVFDHAHDLFASLDFQAELCREVSCVARRDGGLAGWAKDPITAGQALDHLLGPEYFRDRAAHAVCFGAGGAGIAIAARLLTQEHPPEAIVLVDPDERRLELARTVEAKLGGDARLRCECHGEAQLNDRLVAGSPPGSLVVNATGMGKDRPGAPITEAVAFPQDAVAWDLNYRGDLDFLRLAARQPRGRHVRAADGWRYFLHGWTEVIAEVFELELKPRTFDGLAVIAARMSGRPTAPNESES